MKEHTTTPVLEPVELPGTISSDGPRPLPYTYYPKARDVARHGVQAPSGFLPLVDFALCTLCTFLGPAVVRRSAAPLDDVVTQLERVSVGQG